LILRVYPVVGRRRRRNVPGFFGGKTCSTITEEKILYLIIAKL
jgi:hypothetical protein